MNKQIRTAKKIILGIAVVALFGTVTNYVYLSPILTLLLPLCVLAFRKEDIPRSIFWLYVFTGIFLLSAVLYDWHSIFTFGFYRRDGNFIISYSPLLVLPLFSLKFNLKKTIRYFYYFTLSIYSVLFIYHFATLHRFSYIGYITFGGLFYAPNAFGGFMAVIAGLGFSYYYHRRGTKEFCFFFAVFVMLITTYSRGSILGFLMAVPAWYCVVSKRFKTLAAIIAIPVILTIISLSIAYPYYKDVLNTHSEVSQKTINRGSKGFDIDAKQANSLRRILLVWPQAWYIFLHSPIFGTGVGSFDDRPLKLKKVMPLVSYNTQPNKVHTDRHAHHSYLMFLAEQGVFGLTIFLIFWVSLFFYILNIRGAPVLRDFLIIAYFTLTFASFTEHRITTPSNMLPFTIILGLVMAHAGSVKTYFIKKRDE